MIRKKNNSPLVIINCLLCYSSGWIQILKDRSIFTATKKQIKIWSQTEIQIHRDILFYTWKETFKKRKKRLANRFVESSIHTFKNDVIHTCSESTSSSVPRKSPLSPEDLENQQTSGVLTGVLWGYMNKFFYQFTFTEEKNLKDSSCKNYITFVEEKW